MSYEKVKSIKIDEKEGKVFINCASNNCRPITYSREEYPYFSKILQEEGREAVEIQLLKDYESGNLQEGKNKYTKALKVLRYVFGEEYRKFNWRNGSGVEYEKICDLRKTGNFTLLLKKCLDYKFPKQKYVITKKHSDSTTIYGKKRKWAMGWTRFKAESTKFDFEKEARLHIFEKFKDEWEVEKF